MAASIENISNLIAQPAEVYTPEPRHVSKYRDSIIRESKQGKSAHKTLGVASVELDSPNQFLKKRSGSIPKKPTVPHEHYRRPDYQRKLPEWQPVKASDREKRESQTTKDFQKQNVAEAKNLRPSKARMYYVDDRHGTSQPLESSGMYPHYINRMNYGVPPGRVTQAMNHRSMRKSSPRQETMGERKSRKDEQLKKKNRHDAISPRRGEKSFFHKAEKKKSKGREKLKEQKGKFKEQRGKSKDHKERSRRTTSPRSMDKKIDESKDKTEEKLEGEAEVNDESKEHDETKEREDEVSGSEENSQSEKSRQSTTEDASRTESKSDEEEQEKDERSGRASLKSEKNKPASKPGTVEHQQPRCRYVTEDERAEILYGMKKKWDEMMKQFQGLPFLTDTQPKTRRKNQMEKDLLQLEKDIETIERHPYIYVYSDSEE